MKNLTSPLLLIFLLIGFISAEAYSQCLVRGPNQGRHSAFSVELGGGLLFPITPSTEDLSFEDAFKIEGGVRYLPENKKLGVRGYYSYSKSSDIFMRTTGTPPDISTDTVNGNLEIHRVELQGVYILDDLLNIHRRSNFELESYLGVGLALGKASDDSPSSTTYRMGSATIGLRPRLRLPIQQLHVYLDASYAMLFNQNVDYAGQPRLPAKRSNMGSMAQVSIGLSYRI